MTANIYVLRVDVLGDPDRTLARVNRGDFTPAGFEHVGPAEIGFNVEKAELKIRPCDPEEAAHWSIGPTGQLQRDAPLPPPPRGVVY